MNNTYLHYILMNNWENISECDYFLITLTSSGSIKFDTKFVESPEDRDFMLAFNAK